jgi:hypothetical protein
MSTSDKEVTGGAASPPTGFLRGSEGKISSAQAAVRT